MMSTTLSASRLSGLYRVTATVGVLAALFFFADIADALAQASSSKNFQDVQKSIGKDVGQLPKFMAIASYAFGAFFAANGLLRLRAWIGDSDRNTLNAAMFRIFIAALLISLPHIFVLANNTLFGSGAGGAGMISVPPPNMGAFKS